MQLRIDVDVGARDILQQLKKKLAQDKKEAIKIALKQAKKEGKEKEFKAKLKAEKQQVDSHNHITILQVACSSIPFPTSVLPCTTYCIGMMDSYNLTM
jgi:hypothetical protein